MLSPLERDPELVAGVGLITARWAALERRLADYLGLLMRIHSAGEEVYYSVANFSQRIDLVVAATRASLHRPRDARIAKALFTKIKRLWKARNYLLHSHYVHLIEYADGSSTAILLEGGGELAIRLSRRDGRKTFDGYAYESRGLDGKVEYVKVNRGTFTNHAEQLSKRTRQIDVLMRAIVREIAILKKSTHPSSTQKPHPRSLRGRHPDPKNPEHP